jgi:hypothetical protein
MANSNPYADYGRTGTLLTKQYTKGNNPYAAYGADNEAAAAKTNKTLFANSQPKKLTDY